MLATLPPSAPSALAPRISQILEERERQQKNGRSESLGPSRPYPSPHQVERSISEKHPSPLASSSPEQITRSASWPLQYDVDPDDVDLIQLSSPGPRPLDEGSSSPRPYQHSPPLSSDQPTLRPPVQKEGGVIPNFIEHLSRSSRPQQRTVTFESRTVIPKHANAQTPLVQQSNVTSSQHLPNDGDVKSAQKTNGYFFPSPHDDPRIRPLCSKIRKDAWTVRACYEHIEKIYEKFHIFKRTSAQLVEMGRAFETFCKDPLREADPNRVAGDHIAYVQLAADLRDAAKWYQELWMCFSRWSLLNMLWSLVGWAEIKDTLIRLHHSCPESVRKMWECSLSNPDPEFSPRFEETMDAIVYMLSSEDDVRLVIELDDLDAQSFIDLVDRVLNIPDTSIYKKIFPTYRKLCGSRGLLPTSLILPADDLEVPTAPVAAGGFGDVYRARLGERFIAVKSLRMDRDEILPTIRKDFCKEVLVWKYISHPNIVRFLGICQTERFAMCMVSVWMANGNIKEYLKKNPGENRIRLLLDVAKGLQYLHSRDVVHGDLKGLNILIDDNRQARLSDFGLASVVSGSSFEMFSVTNRDAGSTRWMAPELIDPEDADLERACPTYASDIYAMGMVMLEIFTNRVPYYKSSNDAQVLRQIIAGHPPERPADQEIVAHGLGNDAWALMSSCWLRWQDRPGVEHIVTKLAELRAHTEPQSEARSTPIPTPTSTPTPQFTPQWYTSSK
ncbi:uncharacterized protein FIBRA_07289 [Fibroporia radiculosa]|uniref:Protein kinase domain-containing protein n=1 Tax=Fibroporia radiculosa TaxID=599839 RepID=J4I0F6_9APHY|nr:uncharacterized protein FIBRA_07289 [Fibroporia radiculosa]CCM05082.1 predicted protein [Fibroporia radiculosa]